MSVGELQWAMLAPLREKAAWIETQKAALMIQLSRLASLAASDDVPISDVFDADVLAAAVAGVLPEAGFSEVHDAVRLHQRRVRQGVARSAELELGPVLQQRREIEEFVAQAEAALHEKLPTREQRLEDVPTSWLRATT